MSWFQILSAISAWILLILGVFCLITSAVGRFRFPDFFTRLHAANIGDVSGTMLMLLGIIVHQGLNSFSVKIMLLSAFLLITNPVTSHALAKAALAAGIQPKLMNKKMSKNRD